MRTTARSGWRAALAKCPRRTRSLPPPSPPLRALPDSRAAGDRGGRGVVVVEGWRAHGVARVVEEVPGQHRALAAALSADERVAVLAVLGCDRHGAALVMQQDAIGVAVDRGRRDRTPYGRARQAGVLDPRAWELPDRGELRCREHARAPARHRVRQCPFGPSRVDPPAQPDVASAELVL